MTSVLKWKAVTVSQDTPIRVTVTGNVDTRVVTRYFWIPVAGQPSASKSDRNDGVELEFDTRLIAAGKDNRLGFACRAAPVAATETSLFIMFKVRQGDTILLEQDYSLDVSDPNTSVPLNDGISLAL